MALQQVCGTQSGAVERRAASAARYALKYALWSLSSLPSVKACGRSVRRDAGVATVNLSADGRAGWSGLNLCSSVSACPSCSARIREQRAREIEAAGVAHLRRGGSLAFATYTMSHKAEDGLRALLDAERAAWKAVQQDKAFRDLKAAYNLRVVRSWEVTYTSGRIGGNGWHPHMHALWFSDVDLDSVYLNRFVPGVNGGGVWRGVTIRETLAKVTQRAWAGSIRKTTGKTPDQFDFQTVKGNAPTSALALTRYLTKVQDAYGNGTWGVGREMASGPSKTGRKRSLTPFQLLERAAGLSFTDAGVKRPGRTELALWHEYEQATKGLRVIEASRGLFASLGVAEVVDDLAPEAGPDALPVLCLSYDDFRILVRFRSTGLMLHTVERVGLAGAEHLLLRLRRQAAFLDGTVL